MFDPALLKTAKGGHRETVELCRDCGATDFNGAMTPAAKGGRGPSSFLLEGEAKEEQHKNNDRGADHRRR